MHAIQHELDQNHFSLWVPALIGGFCLQNRDFWTGITSHYRSQTSPAVLCKQHCMPSIRITSLYGFPHASVVLCMQNSDFRTRLTSLYWSQNSSVVLSTHNSVLSTRLYLFQPSPVVLCSQRATLGPELHVSMGPSPYLWLCAIKRATLGPEFIVSMGP